MSFEKDRLAGRACFVASEGWIFISLFGAVSLAFFIFGLPFLAWPFLALTLFTVYFFRNPKRSPPEGDDLIVSPADGRVIFVTDMPNNAFTNLPAKKVSIFMSVFNVHVNRAPLTGQVENVIYHPGKFLVASIDKASEANERNAVLLRTKNGALVGVVQIAGLVARRIVCYLKGGESIQTGERIGLIRFGSRVDLYLPVGTEINVSVGEKVKAGRTIIGRLK